MYELIRIRKRLLNHVGYFDTVAEAEEFAFELKQRWPGSAYTVYKVAEPEPDESEYDETKFEVETSHD